MGWARTCNRNSTGLLQGDSQIGGKGSRRREEGAFSRNEGEYAVRGATVFWQRKTKTTYLGGASEANAKQAVSGKKITKKGHKETRAGAAEGL